MKGVEQVAGLGIMALAGEFISDSLRAMIPWLIVMIAVILCDLMAGVRRCLVMKEVVRFSKACRDTMGKIVTYISFVVMAVLVNKAAGGEMMIDTYACLMVCFIEGCSIISNILKPKGYNFNMIKLFTNLFCSKLGNLDGVITKKELEDDEHIK